MDKFIRDCFFCWSLRIHKILLFGFMTVALAACATAKDRNLSPAAAALIAPVFNAYATTGQEQAKLAPAATVSERLLRLGIIDQVGRSAWHRVDLSSLPIEEQKAAHDSAWDEIDRHDLENQRALKSMLPPTGWFSESTYGKDAADAAFYIVQHAVNDIEFQKKVLGYMTALLQRHEVSGPEYALLYDRLALHGGGLQRYGTQMNCENHRWVLAPMEYPANADERRHIVGFQTPLEKYVASFSSDPPCVSE